MRSVKKSQTSLNSTKSTSKSASGNSKSTSGKSKTAIKRFSRSKKVQIVGIGASAGGLEALKEFLAHMDPELGMAYVILQHLDPKHGSLSAEILARSTPMAVSEAQDGEVVHSNRVYVIPPNCDLSIKNSRLKVKPRTQIRRQHMCVDTFFTSLAKERKELAVGIILSGTAADGRQGCLAIKSAGGVTFAQAPATAQYAGMPQAAISAGAIDFIDSPEGIAKKISKIDHLPRPAIFSSPEAEGHRREPMPHDGLSHIFQRLKIKSYVDFSQYKPSTIRRRISRRMSVLKLDRMENYAAFIDSHPEELNILFVEILIHVTEFFRDAKVFDVFVKRVLPNYMKERDSGLPFRVWVPGCSTGEEAYSIAITLLEYFSGMSVPLQINIFATDISEASLQKARLGVYPESISQEVSKERLKRFFEKVEGGYRISKLVRNTCLFSRHDVISNVPFAKLDLISCRNLLIYFTTELQQQILPVFHYALNSNGILWLGRSETIGGFSNLFSFTEKVNKFYTKKNVLAPLRLQFPVSSPGGEPIAAKRMAVSPVVVRTEIQREADRLSIAKYVPAHIVINEHMEVLHARGHTAPYLELSAGASLNLFKLARPELVADLRLCIQTALKKNAPARKEDLTIHEDGRIKKIGIEILPIPLPVKVKERCFIIFFKQTKSQKSESEFSLSRNYDRGRGKTQSVSASKIAAQGKVNTDLLKKLAATQEYQLSIVEQYETAQEELTSANEELQSTNEEFQSTNEELETAREELQSTNEELTTVNDELQTRNVEMIQLTHDLTNLLTSIDIPIVMLGPDRKIRRFTPNAGKVLKLIPTDVGRSIGDIQPDIRSVDLDQIVYSVMKTRKIREIETQDRQGHWYKLQVRPYRGTLDRSDGAVIALMDINALKRGAQELKTARDDAMTLLESVPVPLLVVDSNMTVKMANRSFYNLFKVQASETIGRSVAGLGKGQWNIPELLKILNETLITGKEFQGFEVNQDFPVLGHKSMVLNARKIHLGGSGLEVALLAIEDFTELKQIGTREKEALRVAEQANRIKDEFLATLSHELRTPLTSILSWTQLLRSGKIDSEKAKRGLEILENSAKTQGQLINDLLDISRIQAGKLTLEIQNVNPATAVYAALDAIRTFAEEKCIQIETEIDPNAGNVLGDSGRLQQIFSNLLTNSVKFTPKGGKLLVRLNRIKTASGESIRIQVKDTGKGIPPEFLSHIFKRFTQADSSSIRAQGGLGLGLSIVSNLVELHGGRVEAESEGEGKGATFTVLLPLKPIQPNSEGMSVKPNSLVSQREKLLSIKLNSLKIMVVEDEPNAREVIALMLESYGAEVKTAESALQAMHELKQFGPDILVSDIAMPEEDGYSLIRKIRKLDSKQSKIPAIALTAYAGVEDWRCAMDAGFNSHISKPADEYELVRTIAKLVGRGPQEN